jgi:hypothetical protein
MIAAALLLCVSAAAEPTLYRWVDKNGTVHYSDQPAVNAQQFNPNPLDGHASPGGAASGASQSDAATQQAECKSKGEELGRYKNAAAITETDALGNTREYSAEQKNQLVVKTQQYIDEHCADATAPAS